VIEEMAMPKRLIAAALFVLSIATTGPAFAAGSEADYKAALAAAQAAEQQAGALKNQWTTTEQALSQAKKDAAAGDFDKATAAARQAEALAKASIAQSKEQAKAWKDADIR
jgi:hypothetical protein